MKRLISWMLVLCMALNLVPAGLAEELFAEESFFDAGASMDEEVFSEEGFFGDESLFTPAEEVLEAESKALFDVDEDLDDEDAVIESRSIVSLSTDQASETVITDGEGNVITAADTEKWAEWGYWKAKPTLKVTQDAKKSDVLILEWAQAIDKTLPKDVKYYIYEIDEDTGVAYQVGKPVKAKKVDGGFGNKIKLKKLEGDFTYFVRAEKLVEGDKKNKLYFEYYGISSDHVGSEAYLASWKNKVKKIIAAQQGTQAVVSFVDSNKISGFRVTVMKGKGKNKEKIPGGEFTFTDKNGNGEYTLPGANDPSAQPAATLTSSSSGFTFRWNLPADYADNDIYSFKIEPVKLVKKGKEQLFGKPMTSKGVKLTKSAPWKTLYDLEVEEVSASASDTEIRLQWDVPYDELAKAAVNYVITGLLGGATITVNLGADGKPALTVDKDKKNAIIKDKSTAEVGDEDGVKTVEVTVYAKTKLAAEKKISILPKQGKVKGVKTTTPLTFGSLVKPEILSGAQIADGKVTIRFTQGSVPAKDEAFIITGFAKKTTVKYDGKAFTADNGATAELLWNEDTQQDDIIAVTSDVKVGAKAAKKPFTVKAKLGKKSSKASDKFIVGIRPSALAAALNVKFSTVEDIELEDHSMTTKMNVIFTVLEDKANIKQINVSLVNADSMKKGEDGKDLATKYSERVTLSGDTLVIGTDKTVSVPFQGVAKGESYSAFVEVILTTGRIVETTTSVAAGERAKDPRLVIGAEQVKAFQDAVVAGKDYYYDTTDRGIWLAGKEDNTVALPVASLYAEGTKIDDLGWQVYVDGEVKTLTGANFLVDKSGEIEFRIRPTFEGAYGDWIDAKIWAYRALIVSKYDFKQFMEKAMFEIKYEGGSGEATMVLKAGEETVDPSKEVILTDEEKDYKLIVTDNHIKKTADNSPLTAEGDKEVKLKKSKYARSGAYTYEKINEDPADTQLRVVKYSPLSDEEANRKTPTVPDKEEFFGTTYTVLQISGMGEGEGYKGAFQGNTDITAVSLPNAIQVIGDSAFSGCTNLASMTCY